MLMFHRARVIVAPHGSGLANMIFSRPGTYIIEAVCPLPNTNYVFMMAAYQLGLIYYGVAATTHDVINLEPEKITQVLQPILENIKS